MTWRAVCLLLLIELRTSGAQEPAKTGEPLVRASLPSDVTGALNALDTSQWYPWVARNVSDPGAIGLADWLVRPAGAHGRIACKGDQYFYDGRPIVLWGINLSNINCYRAKEVSEKRASLLAKYGLNIVRFHKYAQGCEAWDGMLSLKSFTQMVPDRLDLMDYQIAKLKEAGIYFSLSPHIGLVPVGPDDVKTVPYIEEIKSATAAGQPRKPPSEKNPYRFADWGALYYSREVQDLQIQHYLGFLQHRNPYTGLTYAEEPALAYIEIVNEQGVFFQDAKNLLSRSATLRERTGRDFCAWLKGKYGSKEKLLAAWGGDEALRVPVPGARWAQLPAENVDAEQVWPQGGSGGEFAPTNLTLRNPHRQRALDTMEYLKKLQDDFHDRLMKALREAGYTGEFVASNWNAGRGIPNMYNLDSYARVGAVDRHYYYIWAGGSMFDADGGGKLGNYEKSDDRSRWPLIVLSKGMDRVAGRPFGLSEWAPTVPNDFYVESLALYAAYGMGLQGWNLSEAFYTDEPGFSSSSMKSQFCSPPMLGMCPAISRQVLRGDVRPSEAVAYRYVHGRSLAEGRLSFDDFIKTSDKIPARALAVVRHAVKFTEQYADTPVFDIKPYERDGGLRSSTGQLFWKDAVGREDGYFTIDTPGTKAFIGWGAGKDFALGEVTISPQSPFCAIYVTALERDRTLATSKRILVSAMARARNAEMKYRWDPKALKPVFPVQGYETTPPVLVEPVRAMITLKRSGAMKVALLDHDGLPTEGAVPANGGMFGVNGVQDKTPYYLVEFQ